MNAPKQSLTHRILTIMPVAAIVALGQHLLAEAERNRRSPSSEDLEKDANLRFDPAPTPDGDPAGDWAAAGTLISRAMHHLDESIPNGQAIRTNTALGALVLGVDLLKASLERRGLQAATLVIGTVPAGPAFDPLPTGKVFGPVGDAHRDRYLTDGDGSALAD